jgi:aminoglycoside phosphotransferase (APT) family kinase protein
MYASNVLIAGEPGARRVCAVDWEMAAVGPGLMDLAALTSGSWREDHRQAIVMAYHEAIAEPEGWRETEAFLRALDACRLHIALQWLGWSPGWAPPPEHAHDWLDDALRLAERLELLGS